MPELTIISVDGRNGVITEEERLDEVHYATDMEVGCSPSPQCLANSLQNHRLSMVHHCTACRVMMRKGRTMENLEDT
jgi:hypothetical protein